MEHLVQRFERILLENKLLRKALESFVDCVDAVGLPYVRDDEPEGLGWTDLELTYYNGREVLGKPYDHKNPQ